MCTTVGNNIRLFDWAMSIFNETVTYLTKWPHQMTQLMPVFCWNANDVFFLGVMSFDFHFLSVIAEDDLTLQVLFIVTNINVT